MRRICHCVWQDQSGRRLKLPALARPLYTCILIKPMALTRPHVQTTLKASCTTPSVAWMVEAIVKRAASLAWCDKAQKKNRFAVTLMRQSPARRWVLLRFLQSRLPCLCGVVFLIDRCAWESNAKKSVACAQQGDCLCLPEEAGKERGGRRKGGEREKKRERESIRYSTTVAFSRKRPVLVALKLHIILSMQC